MTTLIDQLYRTRRVQDEAGNEYELHSEIDRLEGDLLQSVIAADPAIRKTLEVGCAYGLSSLHICTALDGRDNPQHVIIDPFQHSAWHGIGVSNLKRAGFSFFELLEEPSEFILPELARKEPGSFDFIFVDGNHTFDHVMVDLFYASRLLKNGGWLVIDDSKLPSVAKAVSYVGAYPCYRMRNEFSKKLHRKSRSSRTAHGLRRLLPPGLMNWILPRNLYDHYYSRIKFPSMVVLQKVADDTREWNWFKFI